MSTVVKFPKADSSSALDVRPLLKLLEMQFVAAVINDNEYRLGCVIAAAFQQQGEFDAIITREDAAQTAVLKDGVPLSGRVDSDPKRFAHSLMMLQLTVGIFSHSTKAGVTRAKDRFTNFAYNLRADGDPELIMKQSAPVYVQFRPSTYYELYEEAQRKIVARIHTCRFANIDTADIEAMKSTL